MNLPVKKIISASAGTGKTYRLSLEFIALLLQYYGTQEFRPDQILVITFTKKATAEIRARIFSHLEKLGNRIGEWRELALNLKRDILKVEEYNPEDPLTEAETNLILHAWKHLSTHKDELQVMTIDSYVHSIFRNLVRPVRGIDRFELDLKAVDKRIPFLFNELMTPALLSRLQKLLSRRLKPSLDEFKSFFRSLIDKRWLYYLAAKRSVDAPENSIAYFANHPEQWEARSQEYKSSFLDTFRSIIISLSEFLLVRKALADSSDVIREGYLNREFLQLFNPLPEKFSQLSDELEGILQDDHTLLQLLKLLDKDKYLWNGQKVRSSKENRDVDTWKIWHKQALEQLSNYLVFHLFLPEQQEILNIWEEVLNRYDKLIYRYKNFTYDDIAWFTFEALYSSHPPLFEAEPEAIANEFYEFMCHRTRFMLIDEFQDTSTLQFHILSPMMDELLAGAGTYPYGGIIVVGDEKQSIFGWRGGQRDLLLNLETIFQSGQPAVKEALTTSWRSSPALMQFINGIFGHTALHEHLAKMQAEWEYADTSGMKLDLEQDTVVHFQLGNYSSRSIDNKIDKTVRRFITDMVLPALPLEGEPTRSIAILARRNDDLEMIRAILSEHNITSEFQSSKSLLDHPVIKAVFHLLRFGVYHDWYDFLAFLRSDLVLMHGADLKKVINIISDVQQNHSETLTEAVLTAIPKAQAALELAASLKPATIHHNCLTILQTCQVQNKLNLQRDFANIQRFLDLAMEYESNYQTDLPELQGFLRFCEDNRDQEIMQQQDVESSTAIQLLTIHKSKGLEFDSVFVWWNLKCFSGREDSCLSSWVKYTDKSYHNLSDIAISLHYNKVLQTSAWNEIMLEDEKREQLEELNNLYVALTRARSRLYLFACYEKQEGWDKYWSCLEADAKLSPPHFAILAASEYMQTNAKHMPDCSWLIDNRISSACSAAGEQVPLETDTKPEFINLRDKLADWKTPLPDLDKCDESRDLKDWKTSYLIQRDNLKGNIAHYYLAQIKYAEKQELEKARMLTLRQFGNLMNRAELYKIIAKVESQLPHLADLFSNDYDIVFTEYPVFHKGKEYRLDRLMFNTKAKTFRIIDYKTGLVYQEKQIEEYQNYIKNILPTDFTPEQDAKFISIDLPA